MKSLSQETFSLSGHFSLFQIAVPHFTGTSAQSLRTNQFVSVYFLFKRSGSDHSFVSLLRFFRYCYLNASPDMGTTSAVRRLSFRSNRKSCLSRLRMHPNLAGTGLICWNNTFRCINSISNCDFRYMYNQSISIFHLSSI